MRPAHIVLALALVSAGAGGAFADPYSRKDCNQLRVDYADALTTAAPADLEKGPEWASANLDLERLRAVERLIDLEADLELRCRMSRQRIAAIKPERRPVIPDLPERKVLPLAPGHTAKAAMGATPAINAVSAEAKLATTEEATAKSDTTAKADKKTATAKHETAAIAPSGQEPDKSSNAGSPASTAEAPDHSEVESVARPASKLVPKPPLQAAKSSDQESKRAPGPSKPANAAVKEAKKPAAEKKKRRANAYVSPREVAPFSLYQNGSSW